MTAAVTEPRMGGGAGDGISSPPPTGGGGGDGGGGGRGRRRSKLPIVVAASVAVVVAVLVAVLATSKSAQDVQNQANSLLIDKPAPPIKGPPLDGGNVSLADYRGRWVLVNFFASWCVPCQQEQGDLVHFQNQHQAPGDAAILAVRFNDPDVGPIRQLMDKSGAHWAVVDDPQAKFDWGVTGPPETFLVNPQGVVVAHVVGRIYAPQMEALLGRLEATSSTGGPSPSTGPSPGGAPSTSVGGTP
jgi:cytochrome c biogenesis protein CcmG/thiol:disulfide interchange protein DsbE